MPTQFFPDYHQGQLDPQAMAFLARLAESNLPPSYTLTPEEVRQRTWPGFKELIGKPAPVGKIINTAISGPYRLIPLRVYIPKGEAPFPLLVYFHGGGWVIWDLDVVDPLCRSLTNKASCVVVSVDYRLAPEHKFPSAVEDAYSATKWIGEHADYFQGDPTRLAVGGDSAGGNLAAVTSQIALGLKGPRIFKQILICPSLDISSSNTESFKLFGDSYWVSKDTALWFRRHYLNDEGQARDPNASPLLSETFADLPPTLLITAEFDILRDEAISYRDRLREAGVPVQLSCYSGMLHDFVIFGGIFDRTQDAINEIATFLGANNSRI